MRVLLSVVASLLLLAGAHATALTTILKSGEKTCYYADVDGVGEKVGASCFSPPHHRALETRRFACSLALITLTHNES